MREVEVEKAGESETADAAATDRTNAADAADAAERLRRRYPPPRVPRFVKVLLVAVGTAIALSWLVWAGLVHATPVASGQVSAYKVLSDTAMQITISVERRDPSVAVSCQVVVQASDFSSVGEKEVPIAASPYRVVDTTITVTTLRRATSASVKTCARV